VSRINANSAIDRQWRAIKNILIERGCACPDNSTRSLSAPDLVAYTLHEAPVHL